MKLVMRPVGAGGLIWLVATACGESSSGSDPAKASDSSDSTASSAGSTGNGTGAGTGGTGSGGDGSTGDGTTGDGTTGDGSVGTSTTGVGGTGSEDCPNIEPPLDASCANEGLSCAFTNCVAPNFRNDHTLTCLQGAWALADEVECHPNCPDTAPAIGDPCEAQATPGPCPVVDVCGTTYAYCSEGEWSLQPSGAAPELPDGAGGGSNIIAVICPNPAPALGSACCPSLYPSYCDYSGGQGVPGAGGSDAGFVPPGTTGGTGGADTTTGSADASSTGAKGAASSSGGTGATGGTGASILCIVCDPAAKQWYASSACN